MENSNNFTKAMEFVGKWEWRGRADGGLTDNPVDPGGVTKWGISKRANPDLDIKNLTLEQALQIYWDRYWLPSGCNTLALPLAVVAMDSAVNCGVGRVKRWLKETDDPKTLIGIRKLYYYSLKPRPGFEPKQFIKGWLNRLLDLDKFIHILMATP